MVKANFHNKSKIKQIGMLSSGKANKNSRGEIIKAADFQSTKKDRARIEPSRNWFTNTKTVTQEELEEYRNNIRTKSPYDVLLSTGNVPYSLINNDIKVKRKMDYTNAFGKKVKTAFKSTVKSIEELKEKAKEIKIEFVEKEEKAKSKAKISTLSATGKRSWSELYKVLDSSDIVVHVLDARDPLNTKNELVEKFLKDKQHKTLIYLLNKVDLVPTNVTAAWLRYLSKENVAVAYHANSLNYNYGKQNLLNIFRQLRTLHKKKPTMSIGFVGYPNTGKSSIINSLRNKKVCSVAPVPGQTKVWQYITLTKNTYMIDSPGVCQYEDKIKAVLSNGIRIENLEDMDMYVEELFKKVKKEVIENAYKIEYTDKEDFYVKMGKKYGKLVKGGEPNIDLISKMVLQDYFRGKISCYVECPE